VPVSVADIRRLLDLQPLPMEGGFFRETYRSAHSSAIYYLLTPGVFSAIHRLPGDELFHFYLGDPVEMLQLWPDGSSRRVVIGSNLDGDARPQVLVPGGVWQGCRLREGGRFALMGTTMAPGFDARDFQPGLRAALLASHPGARDAIVGLTHD